MRPGCPLLLDRNGRQHRRKQGPDRTETNCTGREQRHKKERVVEQGRLEQQRDQRNDQQFGHAEQGQNAEQLPYIRRLLEALRIPVLARPGYEADDVIGTLAWQAAGLPVVRGRKVMSLGRQVQIVMGCLILGSSLLAFYSIYWIALVAFFGAGLIFSGIANFCGWSPILARMPWNRRNNSATGSPHPHNSFAVPRD